MLGTSVSVRWSHSRSRIITDSRITHSIIIIIMIIINNGSKPVYTLGELKMSMFLDTIADNRITHSTIYGSISNTPPPRSMDNNNGGVGSQSSLRCSTTPL